MLYEPNTSPAIVEQLRLLASNILGREVMRNEALEDVNRELKKSLVKKVTEGL